MAGLLHTGTGICLRFFMVWPFVKRLRNFIKRRRKAMRAGEGKPHQDPEQGVKVPTDGGVRPVSLLSSQ